MEKNFFTPRTRVFTFLTEYIAHPVDIILLRAPFASGKTGLIQEAHSYYKDQFTVLRYSNVNNVEVTTL